MRAPDKFAAVAPICGGGMPVFARLVAHKPLWFSHAVSDGAIGVEETDALVAACGGPSKV